MSQENHGDETIEMDAKQPLVDGEVKIINPSEKKNEFIGLTKEELKKFENDPFWKKLRLGLFIAFWLLWAAMLVAAIVIIVVTPKCPQEPKLKFWQKETAYLADPWAFKDTDENNVGDIQGVIKKLNYVKDTVGANILILDSIFNSPMQTSKPNDFKGKFFEKVDPKIGSLEDVRALIRDMVKKGMYLILRVPSSGVSTDVQVSAVKFWMNEGVRGFIMSKTSRQLYEIVVKFSSDSSKERVLITESTSNNVSTEAHGFIGLSGGGAFITTRKASGCESKSKLDYAQTFLKSVRAPIVYATTELGGDYSQLNGAFKEYPGKGDKNLCHMPMPWDSAAVLKKKDVLTVKRAVAIGEKDTHFQLHKQLADLRSTSYDGDNKVLIFGAVRDVTEKFVPTTTTDRQVLLREYNGFKTHIIVLHKKAETAGLYDFSSVCKEKVEFRLVFPSNPQLVLNKPLNSRGFYFKTPANSKGSIYVLRCA